MILQKTLRGTFEQLRGKKDLVGVEVGVAEGRNAWNILNELDIKKLYLVDVWGKYEEESRHDFDSSELEEAAKENLKDFKQCVFFKGLSVDVAATFHDEMFDFVYLDANHEYKYVKEDIEAWLPKVKKGGLLGGDDLDREGVNKAVQEAFPGKWPLKVANIIITNLITKEPMEVMGDRDWYVTA